MTNQQHPITPPEELVQQWHHRWRCAPQDCICSLQHYLITQAAQWGADQELEACCAWAKGRFLPDWSDELYAARRPKPPSLKEQALLQLDTLNADLAMHGCGRDLSQIRRALEALPE